MGDEKHRTHALRFHSNDSEQLVIIIWLPFCTRQISLQREVRSDRIRSSIGGGALPFWLTSSLAWTVISLDTVSVRIDDEGGVVVEAINRAQTGGTIVIPARCAAA